MAKIRANRAHTEARTAAEPERPEWEPFGSNEQSTLERHAAAGEVRVRPDALADAKRAWIVGTPMVERAHWQDQHPDIPHECQEACDRDGCPDDRESTG